MDSDALAYEHEIHARLCPRLAPAARRVCDMLTHTQNTYDQYYSIESRPGMYTYLDLMRRLCRDALTLHTARSSQCS